MAVPYDACDQPSARAEYKQPDAAIILTHLAYYQRGMAVAQVAEIASALRELEPSQRTTMYRCRP